MLRYWKESINFDNSEILEVISTITQNTSKFQKMNDVKKSTDLDKNGKLFHDEYHELFGHGS